MPITARQQLEERLDRDAALVSLGAWIFAGIIASGLLTGCDAGKTLSRSTARGTPSSAYLHPGEAEVSIGVIDEGWHTSLILPIEMLGPPLAGLRYRFPHAKYLVFGWGNRSFYQIANPGMGAAIASLFPSASIIFVQGLSEPPQRETPPGINLRWLCISPSGNRKLDVYLDGYLQKGGRDEPVSVQPGPLPNSEFFESPGTYDAFHTCNTWTVEALRVAGLPIENSRIIFARQVMSEIRSLQSCSR